MTFHLINLGYLICLFFIYLMFSISLEADKRLYYGENEDNLLKIKVVNCIFPHNKKFPHKIAFFTFYTQLLCYVFVVLALLLTVISLYCSQKFADWAFGIYSVVLLIVFICVSIIYGVKYGKRKPIEILAEEDPNYVKTEVFLLGRNELDSNGNNDIKQSK